MSIMWNVELIIHLISTFFEFAPRSQRIAKGTMLGLAYVICSPRFLLEFKVKPYRFWFNLTISEQTKAGINLIYYLVMKKYSVCLC